jgi:hypothetical protein
VKKIGTDLFLTLYGRCRIEDGTRLSSSLSGGWGRVKIEDGRTARAGGMMREIIKG